MQQYDYLIVGAGLYGAVMAHELNKKGKKYMISAAIIAVLFAALSIWYSSYTIDLLTAESRMHLSCGLFLN